MKNKTDSLTYNAGRLEGHADICAKLRRIIDPLDEERLNLDGILDKIELLYLNSKSNNLDNNLSGEEICLTVIGLPENIANKIILSHNYKIGISARDNFSDNSINSPSNNRINLTIMAGIVTQASIWKHYVE